ncbi:MAG: VTT domain-containing protein [Verrucomicrobiae bacterium]|nr:VTT domain-containing protein [Verrucomicrobiae bacterium]
MALPPHPHHKSAIPVKTMVVFGLLLLGVAIIYLTPLKSHLSQAHEIKEWLKSFGWPGRFIFLFAVFALVAAGLPRLAFCPLGGMVYGFGEGLIWTQAATLMGYYTIFLFVRWGGRDWVLRHHPALGHIHEIFGKRPALTIFLVRQLPISGLLINLFLGVSRVRHRDFLLGSLFGLLPEAIPLTLVGSSAGKFNSSQVILYVAIAAAVLLLVMLGSWLLARSSKIFDALRGEFETIEDEDNRTRQ